MRRGNDGLSVRQLASRGVRPAESHGRLRLRRFIRVGDGEVVIRGIGGILTGLEACGLGVRRQVLTSSQEVMAGSARVNDRPQWTLLVGAAGRPPRHLRVAPRGQRPLEGLADTLPYADPGFGHGRKGNPPKVPLRHDGSPDFRDEYIQAKLHCGIKQGMTRNDHQPVQPTSRGPADSGQLGRAKCMSRAQIGGFCAQSEAQRLPDVRKHCAHGKTRTGFSPLQTLGTGGNIPNPGQSGTSTDESDGGGCAHCAHPPFCLCHYLRKPLRIVRRRGTVFVFSRDHNRPQTFPHTSAGYPLLWHVLDLGGTATDPSRRPAAMASENVNGILACRVDAPYGDGPTFATRDAEPAILNLQPPPMGGH